SGRVHHVGQEIAALISGTLNVYLQVQEGCTKLSLGPINCKTIPRNLFANESIIGSVFIKSANHVIAITPHVCQRIIKPTTLGVSITDNVQPVPAPALSIAPVSQQLLDFLFISIRG